MPEFISSKISYTVSLLRICEDITRTVDCTRLLRFKIRMHFHTAKDVQPMRKQPKNTGPAISSTSSSLFSSLSEKECSTDHSAVKGEYGRSSSEV
jgi:hypothetical protein